MHKFICCELFSIDKDTKVTFSQIIEPSGLINLLVMKYVSLMPSLYFSKFSISLLKSSGCVMFIHPKCCNSETDLPSIFSYIGFASIISPVDLQNAIPIGNCSYAVLKSF